MSKPCLQCKKQFTPMFSGYEKNKNTKFCSFSCYCLFSKNNPNKGTFRKGHKTWNKGFVGYRTGKLNNMWKGGAIWKKCLICKTKFNLRDFSIKQRDKIKCCSRKCGNVYRQSNEFRNRLSKIQRSLTPQIFVSTRKLRSLLRRCSIYNRWRVRVFKRDGYTCQMCDTRGGKLHADHIRPFVVIMFENNINTYEDAVKCKKLWSIRNGRTLCKSCHYKTDTFGTRVHRTFAKLIS